MARMARDPVLMGRHRSGRVTALAYGLTIAVVVACVAALAVLTRGCRLTAPARVRGEERRVEAQVRRPQRMRRDIAWRRPVRR